MRKTLALLFSSSVIMASSAAFAQPMVTNVNPTVLRTSGGQSVTISGSNFGLTGAVTIAGNPCTTTLWTAVSITCNSPAGMGRVVPLLVTANGMTSAAFNVAYEAPTLSGITPPNGATAGGTVLTITGTNLGTSGTVTIGGNVCTPSAWTHTQITCTLPAGQGRAAPVVVTVGGQSVNGMYAYGAPVINNAAPLTGPSAGDNNIVINGSNFGTSPVVTIGGNVCVNSAASHTQITCRVPAGMGMQPIVVVAGDQTTGSTLQYVYTASATDAGADANSGADASSDGSSGSDGGDASSGSDGSANDAGADGGESDASSSDAASATDGATDGATSDASSGGDGGASDASADGGGGAMSGGGCGCAVPASTHTNSTYVITGALAALALVASRRRRAR